MEAFIVLYKYIRQVYTTCFISHEKSSRKERDIPVFTFGSFSEQEFSSFRFYRVGKIGRGDSKLIKECPMVWFRRKCGRKRKNSGRSHNFAFHPF